MAKTKVLVLGNDPQINQIEFDKLPKNIITLGVNRIWLKHIPNYFFFNDCDIIEELEEVPETLIQLQMTSKIFSSDWLKPQVKKRKRNIPKWTTVFPRAQPSRFPDSVTTAIHLFSTNYIPLDQCTFYIAGVSLIWQNPSHFWKELDHTSLNSNGPTWYLPRFDRISANFKYLKSVGFEMISVNPNSQLNKMMRYENIGNLYKK
jgi:hypothetical protein